MNRTQPTPLQAFEDASGMCNTCPGELEPAEYLQRDPVNSPPPYPWRTLCAGLAVVFAVLLGVHFAMPLLSAVTVVAAR